MTEGFCALFVFNVWSPEFNAQDGSVFIDRTFNFETWTLYFDFVLQITQPPLFMGAFIIIISPTQRITDENDCDPGEIYPWQRVTGAVGYAAKVASWFSRNNIVKVQIWKILVPHQHESEDGHGMDEKEME